MQGASVKSEVPSDLRLTKCQRNKVVEFISKVAKDSQQSSTHIIEPGSMNGKKVVLRLFFDGSASLSYEGDDHVVVCDSLNDLKQRLVLSSFDEASLSQVERLRPSRISPDELTATVQELDNQLRDVGAPLKPATVQNISVSGICVRVSDKPTTSHVEIVATLPTGEVLQTIAKVIHYSDETKHLGCEFFSESPPLIS